MNVLRRLAVRAQQQAYRFLLHNPDLREELFATSYVVSQPVLAAARGAAFAYCLAVLATNLAVNVAHGAGWSWPAYFTTLTFIGIAMYYGVATCVTVRYMRARWARAAGRQQAHASILRPVAQSEVLVADAASATAEQHHHLSTDKPRLSEDNIEIAEEQALAVAAADVAEPAAAVAPSVGLQVLLATQWLLYESFTCFAPLVSLVYWALLFPTQPGALASAVDLWTGISMHALNCVLMALEVAVLARIPYRWTHLPAVTLFMGLYLGLAYFMVGVYDFYVYPFFDPRYFGGYIAVMCLFVTDIVAITWVLMLMVHRLRDGMYPRWAALRQQQQQQQPQPIASAA
ncbi:hypothetical protein H4R18_005582 [Coemansia javaensis]|uniref:Uncharacterized protein n=1 Tax=Coemansia javaensis TaxID=2761396 RepID=A0A9W8H8N7_9FUNG|nr:hypothetical protein H4R18_005582 [Coemansia javaensis]